jgi:hypothetical protein
MTPSDNPLKKYFRHPEIHLKLPSGGNFYPAGSLDLPPTGEIPIFPMTAIDEITSRTPDALFNGSALVSIVSSCAPNIKDPWSMPTIDISALLAAIRLASYGHEMDLNTLCPACGNNQEITIDLRGVLDSIRPPNYSIPMTIGDLEISFMPLSYKQLNDISRLQFDDQLSIKVTGESELGETERMERMGEAVRRLTMLTVRSIAGSIRSIKTTDALVTEFEHILEFLTNCPKAQHEAIKSKIIETRSTSDFKPIPMTCPECNHQYEQEFALDMSNFFETAS